MRKLLLLITILLNLGCFSQEELGGTPVEGIIPIKRVENFVKDESIKSNQLKTTEVITLTPSSPTGSSTEVGVTEGQISVSLTGGATYNIPIAVPPGINGIVPQVGLVYNSHGGNDLAGYGWNVSGISVITRIPSTKFHDNTIDAVDFDDLDRFAFDGQRLIVKNGTTAVYGANGTVYETESFSNVKITSFGVHPNGSNYGPENFKVEYPDGSFAYYGITSNSRSLTDWAIVYWQNPQGVRISYDYILTNNSLSINTIKYGSKLTNVPINEIAFIYKVRQRPEQAYIEGQSFVRNTILSEIKVKGNNVGFRNYLLSHEITSLGYERLKSITEKSGDNTKGFNPTVFNYETTTNSDLFQISNPIALNVSNINFTNSSYVSGDFNGDGEMDLLLYPTTGTDAKKKYWLYDDISGSNVNIGFEHNVGSFQGIFSTSWLSANEKLMPMQGWCTVQYNESNNLTSFKNYSIGVANPIYFQYEKTFEFPQLVYYSEHPRSCISPRPPIRHVDNILKEYVSGDFNGDGLTDVIIVEKNAEYTYDGPCDLDGNLVPYTRNYIGKSYFLNLDRRQTSNYINVTGQLNVSGLDKLIAADVNGDGKTDLMHFSAGIVKVYTLNDSKQLILLLTQTDPSILLDKPNYLGDFNGDGKIDFVIPQVNNSDSWSFFFSKGNSFNKVTTSIGLAYYSSSRGYFGIVGYHSNTYSLNENTYVASDFNGDGKTDILYQQNLTIEYLMTSNGADYTNYGDPQITKLVLMENKFTNGTNIGFNLVNTNSQLGGIRRSAIPIFLDHNNVNQNLEYALISGNSIRFFKSTKDNRRDTRLNEIILGNGLKEVISYKKLNYDSTSYDNVFQPSSFTETYPNFDIEVINSMQVVSQLEQVSATQYKKQKFKYYGAVTNVEGLGFLGFRGLARTNWFNDDNPIISSISKHDITKRGAITETFSVLGEMSSNFTNNTPSNFISKANMTYVDELLANKVFKINNSATISTNGLDGTLKEATTTYDVYNNPLTTTSVSKNGSIIDRTDVVTIEYFPPITSPTYVVGRLKKKNSSVTHNNNNMTGEEIYTYNSAHLVSRIQKKGHATNYLTEDNIYDAFGNIIQKKITAIGLTPRITNFTYDTTGRFLLTSTDVEGLVTTYTYNTSNGLLLTQTLPSNAGSLLRTTYLYDVWGKKTKETDYLGKSLNYSYSWLSAGTNGFLGTSSAGDDNSASFAWYDDLGRKIADGFRIINDASSSESNNSWTTFEYDIYDRVIKTYEPKLTLLPTWEGLYTTTSFDVYGRTTQVVEHTGKTSTINYNGLTTTASDGVSNNTIIKNSLGNVVSMTDNGGTINYQYYANGNLKKTSYNGTDTVIEQDGWGRKTKLTDPSAGPYEYAYNELGEITMEKTPNGQTDFVYNDFGKITQKTVTGLNVNSITTYTYNQTSKLLDYVDYWDITDMYDLEYYYTYDGFKRLVKTKESRSDGLYEFINDVEYDDFGRVYREQKSSTAYGKTTAKWIKNTYKNGYHWQILDEATNQVLWQTNVVNERGQLTSANYGNGLALNNGYDQYGFINRSHVFTAVSPNTDVLNLYTTFESQRGNLTSRTNSLFNWTENFEYDTFDRLTHYTNAQGIQVAQIYENDGRIKENTEGKYNYNNQDIPQKVYQHTSIDVNPSSKAYYENRLGLFNDGMEKQMGWFNYEPNVFSFDNTVSHSGTTSFKINNTTTGEKAVNSEDWIKIGNDVPTEYTYSAWVKSDGTNPEAEIVLFMKTTNETGYYTLVDSKTINTSTDWIQIEKTFLVPANIKKLNVRLDNNATGVLWFDDVQIRKTSDATPIERELNISYNTWKSPYEIEETGVDKISFIYNPTNNRSSMFYGGLQADKLQRQYRKHYSADGSMEIKHNTATGEVEFITYIGGDGYSAPVVLKSDGTTQEYLYLHRDYLGSIVAITNQAGSVVEKRLFDAWGEIVKVVDGQGVVLAGLSLLDRGYTGHEHLQSVGLVHMNGRLYDAKLHRFLQPDNFVQDPYNTQNYNRYGYVLNNPLKYSDPSGEWAWAAFWAGAVIGAAAGAAGYLSSAIQTGNWSWSSFGVSILSGAIIGGVSGGISAATCAVTASAVGNAAASSFVASFSPAINIPIGDWSVSATPSIAFGNASGTGISLGVGYSDGNFSASVGYGIMEYSNYNGFGANAHELRYSALINYDDGKTGFSLGTNIWRGDFKQQTGTLGIHSGDFRALYENDGKPFSGLSGDGNDQYRTAALNLSVKDVSLGFNLFTGERTRKDYEIEKEMPGGELGYSSIGKYGEHYKNGFVNERGTPYRLGALTVGYKGYRAGINSEWVRHAIQNVAIHGTWIANQRMFEMKSNTVNGYSQYKTPNQFTTW